MNRSSFTVPLGGAIAIVAVAASAATVNSFVNWENPHVHALEITPDGARLLVVNTPDNRLEVFDIRAGTAVHTASIPVGLDPVSVRARTGSEAWVVNHISDSVSLVDLTAGNVKATLSTLDEPADVVFAGTPSRAFVSCSQANKVLVFDPAAPAAVPVEIAIDAEDPRAMAVSPDGTAVYAAIFESGNRSTILGGGAAPAGFFPPNAVSDPLGPYGGVNPPPNSGSTFDPPQNPANPPPPRVGLIVRKNGLSRWMDDNGGDWTDFITGSLADHSGRPVTWDLPDRDVAIIDTVTLGVRYAAGLMNLCMAIGVNPVTGRISVVGTDATNEVRFEPKLNGRFLRVNLALVDPAPAAVPSLVDLNPHLSYAAPAIPQAQRNLSIGDPRGIVWNAAGTRGYVTGMGSNNVVIVDAAGSRVGPQATIAVGQGPTGVVLDEPRGRLYVLNKFDASVSVIDTTARTELARVLFHDPSPAPIKAGRKHLYDAHETSGLGHAACASCHPDARMDRLAWDLGNPAGDVKPFDQNCNFGSTILGPGPCPDWHPMKGPVVTQTLQDIIGKEPHHWRGDRTGLEEFNQTFMNLQGDDEMLTPGEMQEFEDFLATIHFPPNPFRNFDNTFPTVVPLPGHYFAGVGGPTGTPLPDGSAGFGRAIFVNHHLVRGFQFSCNECHTLPTGLGTNQDFSGGPGVPLPPGPDGELHHAVVFSPVAETTDISIKVPHLRNLYEKVGFEMTQTTSRAGFGFLHDGSVDSLARFMAEPAFNFNAGIDGTPAQKVAGTVAFMLAFSGSDLPMGIGTPLPMTGPLSKDTHAAAGAQLTVDGANNADPQVTARLGTMIGLADAQPDSTPGPMVGLVAKGARGGLQRGYAYIGNNLFRSDRAAETVTAQTLRTSAAAGSELTFTVVPRGTETRIGIDRDEDGAYDRDEMDACSDPADAGSVPGSHIETPALILVRSAAATRLTWTAMGASWDVVRGSLDLLRQTAGDFTAAVDQCLAESTAAPSLVHPDAAGPANVFFLVRGACAGGATYDEGGPAQQGSRDAEIDASPAACLP